MAAEVVLPPMESNPEVMNQYLQKLGVSDKWKIVDVMGLEGEPLMWVPRPVLAVILLFPLSDAYEQSRRNEESEMQNQAQEYSKDLFHLKQVRSNICGTIAIVHGVANNVHCIELKDGLLKKYLNDSKDLDSAARGELLENTTAIIDAHRDVVRHTSNTESSEEKNNHFVTFIHKNGYLYELDGRKSFPIKHGPSTPEMLLEDAAKVCRQFMAREPDNINFNIVALVPSES